MSSRLFPPHGAARRLVLAGLLAAFLAPSTRAAEFVIGGVPLDLQEVTTNVDVYFTSLRLNRAAGEWDVEVTVSNKTEAALVGPVVLWVESFSGTSGPLRADGVSSNQPYFDLSGQLADGLLFAAAKSFPRTLGLGFTAGAAPSLTTRVFANRLAGTVPALGFARSLNQVGQPLPGVRVEEIGAAVNVTNTTDPAFGVLTLTSSAGEHVWKFSRDGYLPVWRRATIRSNAVTVLPYAWLAPQSPVAFTVSPLTGGAASNQAVMVQFGPGSVSQNATVRLTGLDGQTLPALLPPGWSPLQAFWLELDSEPALPASASLTPWGTIGSTETGVLARLEPATTTWQALQLVSGKGTNALNVSLPGSGAYALVVPDAEPATPPPAVVGGPPAAERHTPARSRKPGCRRHRNALHQSREHGAGASHSDGRCFRHQPRRRPCQRHAAARRIQRAVSAAGRHDPGATRL